MTKDEIVAELEELGYKVDRRRSVDALAQELEAARGQPPTEPEEHVDTAAPEVEPDQADRRSGGRTPTPALRGGNWSDRVRAKQAARRSRAGLDDG